MDGQFLTRNRGLTPLVNRPKVPDHTIIEPLSKALTMPQNTRSIPRRAARRENFRILWCTAILGGLTATSTAAEYANKVLADAPKAYYRFNDDLARTTSNKNIGTLGAAGNAVHDLGTVHSVPGAIVGDADRAAFFDFTSRTQIPWNAAVNPPNTQPFTIEAWFYPASDQINGGQCPINNRYAYSGVNRQGWVFFQRNPNSSYDGKPGSEGIGWNFRMFRGSGGSSGLDITSGVPYEIGKWTHVVVVYDPTDEKHATATMYIDGVEAATKVWESETDPAYVANTDDHPSSEAPKGPASLALGNYNNTASSLNPFFGAIDEFAFYPAKLTAAQIQSHYQNATNANRTVSYAGLVQSHNPTVYLRLDDQAPRSDIAINYGELRANGIATHTEEVRHPASTAIAGSTGDGSVAYHYRNGKATTTIPFKAENNPSAGEPFSFEAWLRPMSDRQGGQCPVNNRWVGGTGRTGWVIFQRLPNQTYAGVPINNEGHGWNFRMFTGAGNSGQDVLTGTDYKIGEWQHLVFTWEPQTQNGDVNGNGNDQWEGILTAYVNGVPVATNSAARYSANRAETETGSAPADLGIGSYNAASGLGSNPFEGDIDEVAIYSKYLLTPEQILEHYQVGTNRLRTKNYETLVLTAATGTSGDQRKGPATYLRFNDPAVRPAANAGSTGANATGNLVLPTAPAAGPQSPAFAGFESANPALSLDGVKQFASLNNPPELDITGQITLEAWVKPSATPGEVARIISHGPPTLSEFLDPTPETNAAPTLARQVFLRVDNTSANYTVGSSDGTTTYAATATIPLGDFGTTTWVHLVGTYDGAKWNLYRNGTQIASTAAPVGAVSVPNGDWAIGSSGNGWAEPFQGQIDEVAIYDRALTPAQVQAHYLAATSSAQPIALSISKQGGAAVIMYSGGTLQEATSVDGTYADVAGSQSPYTVPSATTAKFYRVRQ